MTLFPYAFVKPMKIRARLFLFDKPIKCFAFCLRFAFTFIFQGHLKVTLRMIIRPCHTAAILSRETKKALFYHAKPHHHGFHCEAWRGKTKLFWSPGKIRPPCDKGELQVLTLTLPEIAKQLMKANRFKIGAYT